METSIKKSDHCNYPPEPHGIGPHWWTHPLLSSTLAWDMAFFLLQIEAQVVLFILFYFILLYEVTVGWGGEVCIPALLSSRYRPCHWVHPHLSHWVLLTCRNVRPTECSVGPPAHWVPTCNLSSIKAMAMCRSCMAHSYWETSSWTKGKWGAGAPSMPPPE